jgi:hypothetical protein
MTGPFKMLNLKGSVRLGLSDSLDGWWLKSALIAGRNAADDPVTFDASRASFDDIEIVLSRAGGTVSGRVLDEQRRAVRDYSVIVFPVNSADWYYRSRHLKTGRAGESGEFTVDALPGGEYFIAAIDAAVTADNWQNPEFLNSLVPAAQRVRVAVGQRAALELRIIRAVP